MKFNISANELKYIIETSVSESYDDIFAMIKGYKTKKTILFTKSISEKIYQQIKINNKEKQIIFDLGEK